MLKYFYKEMLMKVEEFQKVLEKSLSIIEIVIKKGYFKE